MELEGELVNPLEEDTVNPKEIIDRVWDRDKKPRTKEQLITAREAAQKIVNDLDECIRELDKPNFEEPLEQQYFRIFGIKYPSSPLSLEQYYEVVIPVLKRMTRDNVAFFYEHYGEIIPKGYKYKYYF